MHLLRPLAWLAAALVCAAPARAAPPRSGLGINLDPVAYWQTDWPFIDEMKRAGGWATRCEPSQSPQCRDFAAGASASDTREQDRVELDADGWPRRLPAADDPTVKYRQLSALLFQGNGGTHPAGRYVVLYDGRGTLAYSGAGRRIDAESRPGREVLEVTNRPAQGLMLRLTGTDARDPLRNLRVIGPGGICADRPLEWVPEAAPCAGRGAFRSLEALAAAGQVFHPAFLGDLRGFRALRFTKWSLANTSKAVRWSERAQPGQAFWSGERGVPFEAMFELARATGADPWISLPPFVDDDFARRFGALARASLAPGATLWFEYGNEPWNQAPPYSQAGVLFEQRARALWPDATLAPWQLRLNWYALRSVQLCGLVKEAFGADASRVRCVANSQAANPEVSRTILACELAQPAAGGACAQRLDALAIAPYVGFHLGHNALASSVDRWPDAPDGGLELVFRELTGRDTEGRRAAPTLAGPGRPVPPDGALAQARAWMAATHEVARRFGVPMIAYEGGQHLQTYRGGRTEAMFRAANRDPRMGAVLRALLGDWQASGGELFVAFSYTTPAARGGFWGMKEHQRDDAAPKWQALRALRDAPCWWKGCER